MCILLPFLSIYLSNIMQPSRVKKLKFALFLKQYFTAYEMRRIVALLSWASSGRITLLRALCNISSTQSLYHVCLYLFTFELKLPEWELPLLDMPDIMFRKCDLFSLVDLLYFSFFIHLLLLCLFYIPSYSFQCTWNCFIFRYLFFCSFPSVQVIILLYPFFSPSSFTLLVLILISPFFFT